MTRQLLIVAHSFPPIQVAGTFRTLRFCQHLPQHGWMPRVLTISRESIPDYLAVDDQLETLVPSNIQVLRAGVWHPIAWSRRQARNFRSWIFGKCSWMGGKREEWWFSDQTDRPATSSAGAASERQTGRDSPAAWQRWLQLWCETPDSELGWFWPAFARGVQAIREQRPAVIYSTGPPHTAHMIGSWLHRLSGIPHVIDLRDPWARLPWSSTDSGARRRKLARLEETCIRRAARVVLNTEAARHEFQNHYRHQPANKFVAIPNGLDQRLARPFLGQCKTPVSPWAWQHGKHPAPTWRCCHPGSLYGRRSPVPLLRALRMLQDRGHDVRFEQIGGVEDRLELNAQVASYQVGNRFVVRPPLPRDELLRRMGEMDFFVLIQPGTALQLPSKVFEMLLFRKPILALCDEGATSQLIRKYRLGVVAEATDYRGIASAIQTLVSSISQRPWSADWQAVARDYDGQRLSGRLAEVLQQACDGRCPGTVRCAGASSLAVPSARSDVTAAAEARNLVYKAGQTSCVE